MKTKSCEDSMYQDGKYLSQTNTSKPVRSHNHRRGGAFVFSRIRNLAEPRSRLIEHSLRGRPCGL